MKLENGKIRGMNAITVLQAIILGGVQGATEFLPVSSSGHLVLVADFLNIPSTFTSETLLNFGTILVILIFFRKQIWKIISDLFDKALSLNQKRDVLLKLFVGVAPAVIIGIVFGDFIERNLHGPITVTIMLLTVGMLMVFTKSNHVTRENLNTNIVQEVSFKQALIVGLVQPFALISGTSRSGITILVGIMTGMKVEVAAAFSFLIGLPVILGATLKLSVSSEGRDFVANHFSQFVAGNLASFLIGLGAVYLLMDVVKKRGLRPFGAYRVMLGLAVIVFVLL
ncbi:MAG: undecaprenyl-diphosphate phosphatase [Candidatus Nomurabacteria bacterium]|nr:MAG: undecaprenyl-diphosphate phosphatase [Candidatus Nomurabacteria bacterium]HRV76199.1 undecaprenyl-diphosphate phosphatase [Candidatus Saccharimonadales bacterium]